MKPATNERTSSPRFTLLDTLRGLAALSVVFSHWPHFFYDGVTPTAVHDAVHLPLYGQLNVLYTYGHRAVDFFFCLSGFIFFFLYSEKISAGRVGGYEFSVLRFSRLYPLHVATLLLVAAAQWFALSKYGTFVVYPNNDLPHFLSQLTCTCAWWTAEHRNTFNGPFWSVSVEALLYALFYIFCRLNLRRWYHLFAIILAGLLIGFTPCTDISRGVIAFFAGGLTFLAFKRLQAGAIPTRLWLYGLATLSVWLIASYNLDQNYAYVKYRAVFGDHAFLNGRDVIGAGLNLVSLHSFPLLVFPATVLFLALLESKTGVSSRRLGFLGDISYSSYLLHFPLQLCFIFTVGALGFQRSIFSSPWMLGSFFAVLIFLSALSYRLFELPAQQYLRKRLTRGTLSAKYA